MIDLQMTSEECREYVENKMEEALARIQSLGVGRNSVQAERLRRIEATRHCQAAQWLKAKLEK